MSEHSVWTISYPTVRKIVAGLIWEVRPQQWYKQGVMFLGILFSKNLFNFSDWMPLLFGIASFTATASATYVFNDISDVEADRAHPEKKTDR